MRILVTGASGQVGSATAKFLQAHAAVIGTDRAALDLSKLDLIPQALDKIAPELVINTAAYTAVDRSEAGARAGAARQRRGPWRHGAMVRKPPNPLDPFLDRLCLRWSRHAPLVRG